VVSDAAATAAAGPVDRADRGRRERLIQTLWFEALGLAVVSPSYAGFSGASPEESLLVLAVLSLAMMGWAWLFNSAWDRTELLLAGRAASDRPHRLRALHAVGHEASAAVVTWPLIVASTPLGWGGAGGGPRPLARLRRLRLLLPPRVRPAAPGPLRSRGRGRIPRAREAIRIGSPTAAANPGGGAGDLL
jgi:uncharacterized membrane protein